MEFFCNIDNIGDFTVGPSQDGYMIVDDREDLYVIDMKTKFCYELKTTSVPSQVFIFLLEETKMITLTEEVLKFFNREQERYEQEGVTISTIKDRREYYKFPASLLRPNDKITYDDWRREEIKYLADRGTDIDHIVYEARKLPDVWKIQTPRGEYVVLSRYRPGVGLYQDEYYIFVRTWDMTVDVYRCLVK